MKTMNYLVNKMLMGVVTVGTFAFVFTACSDNDIIDDKNPVADDKQSARQELLEPLALNFFDFDHTNDVQIMNADTTMISVSKAYAEKMGIHSFVNHPTGVWQGQNQRPFHVRATSEKDNGDRIVAHHNHYRRLAWDKPCRTITMNNGVISSLCCVHPGKKYIQNGETLYSDPRVLTIYELLIVSSLPLDWNIPAWAKESLIRHVIGEGIPPKLTKCLIHELMLQL